jgi:hypothetical protein
MNITFGMCDLDWIGVRPGPPSSAHSGSTLRFLFRVDPITLIGDSTIEHGKGQTFLDPGFSYSGAGSVTVTGTVDTDTAGENIITYESSNNKQVRIVRVKVMAATTAILFHAKPEVNVEQRWWHRKIGVDDDNQHKMLNSLINQRLPHQVAERTLSMHELKEKYDEEGSVAACEVCRLKLQCCFDVKEMIRKTIRKRVREDAGASPAGGTQQS